MNWTKGFAALGALAMIAAVGCTGDRAPMAPQPGRVSAAIGAAGIEHRADNAPVPSTTVAVRNALVRNAPLADDITASQNIGPAGGELEIPGAGLRVTVPAGALSRTTTITATALAGDMVAYEFGPHGTRFALPLVLTQATVGTNAAALPADAVLIGGYFTGRDALDGATKRAKLAELLPTLGTAAEGTVAFNVWHFSGYIAGWGRTGTDKDN